MHTPLSNHILKFVPSFEKEVNKVLPYFERRNYPKNHTIVTEQTTVNSFYFVNTGCPHLYYTDYLNKQNTIHFALENWWITEYNSFLGNPSAQSGITSLAKTEVMVVHKAGFNQLLLEFPFMGIYFNMIHMKAYGAALLKQKTYTTVSKKDFHTYF